jgi:hypothetical protein
MKKLILAAAVLAVLAPFAAADSWEALLTAGAASQIAQIRAHNPSSLHALLDLVEQTSRAGRTPVVMFDLDDTLVDTGFRQMSIIREFAAQADVQAHFPGPAAKMSAVQYGDLHYDLGDTLKALGVTDAAVLAELTPFWAARFFDNAYLQVDQANPGGVDYVREVLRQGGKAVYLTGRWEDMRPGTARSLYRMGYPAADGRTVFLMMKPTRAQTDIDFKKIAFNDIALLGQVVGGFENEPANVNAYQERFQTGVYIFLDTRHSTTAAVPGPSIFWVGDFRL